jgi:Cu-Zn family superoxide dismutase
MKTIKISTISIFLLTICLATCLKLNQFRYREFYNLDFLTINPYEEFRAICILQPQSGHNVFGSVLFSQSDLWAPTILTANFTGLTPNSNHGFHIHDYGDLSQGCQSVGEHYNPFELEHGAPHIHSRHAGDLGNVLADQFGNNSTFYMENDQIKLAGRFSIVGRTCVIHLREDDYGNSTSLESRTTGSSGERIACGIVGLLNPDLH